MLFDRNQDFARVLRGRFAFVIVDLPAVLKSSDAAVIARQTDGTVFVIRTGATSQRAVQEAAEDQAGHQEKYDPYGRSQPEEASPPGGEGLPDL